MDIVLSLLGFILLTWGADRFVQGAENLALRANISQTLIGLTLVAFGTSAPEIFVSTIAALENQPGIAVGNALGSNIANIGLVIGLALILGNLEFNPNLLRYAVPAMLGVAVLAWGLTLDSQLQQWDGAVLLVALGVYLTLLARGERKTGILQLDQLEKKSMGGWQAAWATTYGLALLLLGSELLVQGAVGLARGLGVSELVIGLSLVALGTSLPELAATLASMVRGAHGIALGGVLGSNIFNLLVVLALPALLAPHRLAPGIVTREFPVMLSLSLVLALAMYWMARRSRPLPRYLGPLFLTTYCGYIYWLYRVGGG